MSDNQRLFRAKALAVLVCLQLAAAVSGVAATAPGVAATPATPALSLPPAPSPGAAPAEVAKKPFAIDWRAAVFENMHNKIIHFPIALGIAAAVLILVSPRWPHFDKAGQVLLLAAALFGIAAYFTGSHQLPEFRNTPLRDTGELHESLGVATVIGLWLGVVLIRIQAVKRWLWIYAVLLILLISATGFVGGVLAHTDY